ncbi:uncharacterized protein [Argopecten irradians]|uniref:uncharacterized protein isoform X2 n=1 Tax=Argopecten irradians TaxID=31199 RepID=UPI0037229622
MADNEFYEVERVLDRQVNDSTLQYLIRWKGFSEDWDTWEPLDNLLDCLHLIKDFEKKNGGKAHKSSPTKQRDDAHIFAMELISKSMHQKKSNTLLKTTPPKQTVKLSPKSTSSPKSPEKSKNVCVSKDKKSNQSPNKKTVDKVSLKRKADDLDSSPQQPTAKKKKLSKEGKASFSESTKKVSSNNGKTTSSEGGKKKQKKEKTNSTELPKKKVLKKTKQPSLKSENSGKKTSNAAKKVLNKSKKIAQDKVKNKNAAKKQNTKGSPKSQSEQKKDTKSIGKQESQGIKKSTKPIKSKGSESKQSNSNKKFSMKIKLKGSKLSPDGKSQKKKEVRKSSDKSTGTAELEAKLSKIRAMKKYQKNMKGNMNHVEVVDIVSDEESDSSGHECCLSHKKLHPKVTENSCKVSPNNNISVKAIAGNSKMQYSTPTTPTGQRTLQVKISPIRANQETQRKKIHLIDSIKSKKVMLPFKPMSKASVIKMPSTATTSSVSMESLCGDVPAYQYFPAVIPVSPSSMSYRMFLDNLPQQLKQKGGKRVENGDSPPEEMERRISVRQSECAFRYKDIVVKKCSKYTQIWMNTHTKMKNALNPQVIQEICSALNSAKYDDSNLVMFSGLGNVFCQGLDLHYLVRGDKRVAARQMVDALRDFTKSLITFPKPIVAVVTGPAVGLGMTMLPLCDVVYASDKATFHLPYAHLAQTPEGGATYSLPTAVGMAMANELLIAGRKITAIEACQLGLVSQVFWPTTIMQEVIPRIQNMSSMSGKALETTKLLIRSHQRTKLELTNESESNLLLERWPSFETQKAIEVYLSNEKNFIST